MADYTRFFVTHTEPTTAKAAQVWALWEDVNNWPAWDVGLEHCAIDGAFEPGKAFTLRPRGAPESIRAELTEVKPNVGFTDETRLPFGVLRAKHAFTEGSAGNSVTHTIEVEVAPEKADFFAKAIWSGMEASLPDSVRNIVKVAEARH